MIEDFASRAWVENHHRLSDDAANAFRTLWRGFEHLNAAQFDAPWKRRQRVCKLPR